MPSLALLILAIAGVLSMSAPGASEGPVDRSVAVTFDDLPANRAGMARNDIESLRGATTRLLSSFEEHGVPVVGMVNTGTGDERNGDIGRARLELLSMWLDAGHEIGNHTHSHRDFNTLSIVEFQEEVLRVESEMAPLLRDGRSLRYFRHPFLHVGLEIEKRRAFEGWLAENGYIVAPVTMDNDDYLYAAAYATALRRSDSDLARRLAADYVRYMEESVAFWETVEDHVVGRPIRHVLLLHVNSLNADHFGRIAEMLTRRGYRFITLDEALEDEAYELPDDWVGRWGLSWLHRWGLTAGKKRLPDPDAPQWVMEAYEARE